MTKRMIQNAPWPTTLEKLVQRVQYRPGWRVELKEKTRDTGSPDQSHGLTLSIFTRGYDSYHADRGETYCVEHQFAVPPATYNEQSWLRWLFDHYRTVEEHECMEFFALHRPCTCPEGKYEEGYHEDECELKTDEVTRPYAPNHGPGHDPYIIHDYSTDEERRTRYTGVLNA